ncbi:TPA: hypothetical protein N1415_003039 [Salmonella enterica subsp. enterica serovar 4,[5],12:i:-]|nr:hypothetical protein [Salmonella enterica subsp. enterica serovar 4,[5],12:i:-]
MFTAEREGGPYSVQLWRLSRLQGELTYDRVDGSYKKPLTHRNDLPELVDDHYGHDEPVASGRMVRQCGRYACRRDAGSSDAQHGKFIAELKTEL